MTDTRLTPPSSPCARVVFIGAGPGESDLITLRGARLLAQAKVVLYDALADPTLRDLAPDAEWVDVGKRGFSGKPGSDFYAIPWLPAGTAVRDDEPDDNDLDNGN